MPITAKATAGSTLLTPADHVLVLVDFQSQMAFATRSIDPVALRNNAGLVARGAAGFKVPAVLTTAAEKTFSGPMFAEVTDAFPGQALIDRTTMNLWEDPNVISVINATGKDRLVFAGLWTSVCIVDPVLSALEQGYEVYVITDACGDLSDEANKRKGNAHEALPGLACRRPAGRRDLCPSERPPSSSARSSQRRKQSERVSASADRSGRLGKT